MKRFASVISTVTLAVTISSTTLAGTIVGARTSRTGTIVGARTGNIVGARTGNISGSEITSDFNGTRLDFGTIFSENFVEIVQFFTDSPLF